MSLIAARLVGDRPDGAIYDRTRTQQSHRYVARRAFYGQKPMEVVDGEYFLIIKFQQHVAFAHAGLIRRAALLNVAQHHGVVARSTKRMGQAPAKRDGL